MELDPFKVERSQTFKCIKHVISAFVLWLSRRTAVIRKNDEQTDIYTK
jgi:hypothetical protein